MEGQSSNRSYCTLHELNSLIKSAIGDAFPAPLWVTAEIAELKCNQRGHCYMELVERDDEKTVAQVKATVWAYEYRNLSLRFQREAGEPLRPGMKILLLAAVTFHEVYGMSLNVKDIDPTYSLGEMAKKKKEVIERLKKAGVF
jgi:exodeoxyribonuclease VII large subunit